jgi:hypothetical protein
MRELRRLRDTVTDRGEDIGPCLVGRREHVGPGIAGGLERVRPRLLGGLRGEVEGDGGADARDETTEEGAAQRAVVDQERSRAEDQQPDHERDRDPAADHRLRLRGRVAAAEQLAPRNHHETREEYPAGDEGEQQDSLRERQRVPSARDLPHPRRIVLHRSD